tara:strand:- start:1365 stop:1775 length:411 start_codon:yes stop_codon:yes gene_type:complete
MKKTIKCNDIEFKIYVEDTDFQGVVYHANYLKYFERSRSEFLSNANISQKNLREKNTAFVIKGIKINYLKAAELGDQIVVQTSVEKKSKARMIFYQNVIHKITGKEFVNGEVEVCFIDLTTKKPKKFPDDLLLIFD